MDDPFRFPSKGEIKYVCARTGCEGVDQVSSKNPVAVPQGYLSLKECRAKCFYDNRWIVVGPYTMSVFQVPGKKKQIILFGENHHKEAPCDLGPGPSVSIVDYLKRLPFPYTLFLEIRDEPTNINLHTVGEIARSIPHVAADRRRDNESPERLRWRYQLALNDIKTLDNKRAQQGLLAALKGPMDDPGLTIMDCQNLAAMLKCPTNVCGYFGDAHLRGMRAFFKEVMGYKEVYREGRFSGKNAALPICCRVPPLSSG